MSRFFLFALLTWITGNPLLAVVVIVLLSLPGWWAGSRWAFRLSRKVRSWGEAGRLRRTLSINPHDAKARTDLGAILTRQGRFHEARAELEQALPRVDDLPEAHYYLGLCLLNDGEADLRIVKQAMQYFRVFEQIFLCHFLCGDVPPDGEQQPLPITGDRGEGDRALLVLALVVLDRPLEGEVRLRPRALRRLQPGRGTLRVALWAAAVPTREPGGIGPRDHGTGAASAAADRRRGPQGTRPDLLEGVGQAAIAAL